MTIRTLMVLAVVLGLGANQASSAIEEAKYVVTDSEGAYEVRQYLPQIVAETYVDGGFNDVGNIAFRRLFAFISGKNRAKREIDMTAPVSQAPTPQDIEPNKKIEMTAPVTQALDEGRWRITFKMPSEYSLENLPQPLDPNVQLREEPGRVMASIRYSGTWSAARYADHERQLRTWIKSKNLRTLGQPIFARYNSPFTPWFMRRNEILIEIEKKYGV